MARPPIFESYSQEMPPPGPEMLPMSKPAVFGLLLSVLQCLPVISGVGAIILGILGLREVRTGQRIGKPIALAAIAIGVVSTVLWLVSLSAGALIAGRYASVYEAAEQFTRAVASGEFEEARALAGPGVSDEEVALWISDLEVEDARPDLSIDSFEIDEQQFSLEKLWNGPFSITHRVEYRPEDGGPAEPARRVKVVFQKIRGEMRVVDVSTRSARTLPQPDPPDVPDVIVEQQ